LISGWDDQVLATLACIQAGQAQIQDPVLIVIHDDRDERAGRKFDDHWSVLQIDDGETIRGIGIRRVYDVVRPGREKPAGLVVQNSVGTVGYQKR